MNPDGRSFSASAELNREAVADYVAELTGELATLARRHGLDVLSYLLDMAQLEAANATRHVKGR